MTAPKLTEAERGTLRHARQGSVNSVDYPDAYALESRGLLVATFAGPVAVHFRIIDAGRAALKGES
jgi:hypothetical protein